MYFCLCSGSESIDGWTAPCSFSCVLLLSYLLSALYLPTPRTDKQTKNDVLTTNCSILPCSSERYVPTYLLPSSSSVLDISLIYSPIRFVYCVFVAVRAQVSTASLAVIGFADDNLQGQAVGTGADGTTFVLSGTFQNFDVPFTCTSLSLPCSPSCSSFALLLLT